MDKIVVHGGKQLCGTVTISGAKNAALPLMVAALLCKGKTTLHNVPKLRDVTTLAELLSEIGAVVEQRDHSLIIDTTNTITPFASYELVKKMRASIYVLGPFLGRFGEAKVSLPGGCAWGPRPVDLHIKGMEQLGAEITIDNGYIIAKGDLKGGHFRFDPISVGATGNILMAAVLAKGQTTLENCAIEPEITNLVDMLIAMGAQIQGRGTRRLIIDGVSELQAVEFNVIPDRIEAGTYMAAAAMTNGELILKNCEPSHLTAVTTQMEAVGCTIEIGERVLFIKGPKRLQSSVLKTEAYPGFPTDMQAQWMAMMAVADGESEITDTIYTDRFTHAAELMRLNAKISVHGNVAKIVGCTKLKGAPVMSTDLRASASLLLAGLVAEGKTTVARVYHIDRGYESIEKKLSAVGALVERIREKMEFDKA